MKALTQIVLTTAAILAFGALFLYALDSTAKRQETYAAAHNCRYNINGLCYTYDERGYLFPDECRADKQCRESWGL